MSEVFRSWVGRTIDNDLPLTEYLGGSDTAAVFRTSVGPQPAAIKLIAADPATSDAHLARLQEVSKLSHPNLLRILRTGRKYIDGTDYVYVATEFADENLSQILPDRALTPQEARDVLAATLSAFDYLHQHGFVHADLKPANILAVNDQLKLSTDGIHSNGEPLSRPSGSHDAPEAQHSLSPASDIWSLGITLVEVLTQQLPPKPASDNVGPAVPESVPAPFREIAQHCLLRTPELRWSLADISSKLTPKTATAPAAPPTPTRIEAPRVDIPGHRSSKRPFILVGIVAVIVVAIIALSPRTNRNAETPVTPPAVSQTPAATPQPQQSAAEPPKVEAPAPEPTENKVPEQQPVAEPPAAKVASAPPPNAAEDNDDEPVETSTADGVVHQVMPTVIPQARNSIQGKVRVRVKVDVDHAGNVVDSSFVSAGPSKYFSRAAMDAARQWKFAPASSDSRSWNLDFEFRRGGTHVRTIPQK